MAAKKAAKKPVPPALRAHQWQPGQSGNPRGVLAAEKYMECVRICREASGRAAETMVALLDDHDSRVRLMAADKILDRAWGKVNEMKSAADDVDPATAERRRLARERMMALLKEMEAGRFLEYAPAPAAGPTEPRLDNRGPVHQESPPPPEKWPD